MITNRGLIVKFNVRLLHKYLSVIPEVVIGNPLSLKNKKPWIPGFAGMTLGPEYYRLLQEAQCFAEFY